MRKFFHWIIFSVALVSLILAIGIEHPIFDVADRESAIFNLHSLSGFFKEVAFALLIALVISLGIDRRAREEDAKVAEQTRRAIAEDVFKGVFAKELPPKYIEAVVATTLKCPVIREYLEVDYTLCELTDDERRQASVGTDFVRLKQVSRYRLKNVSMLSAVHPIRYFLPLRGGALSALAGMRRLRVREKDVRVDDVAATRTVNDHVARHEYEVRIEPGETVDVLIEAVTIKHRSDNEIWATLLPTLRYDIAITIEPKGISAGVRAITATALTEVYRDAAGGGGRWAIEGPILPNESVVVFWNEN